MWYRTPLAFLLRAAEQSAEDADPQEEAQGAGSVQPSPAPLAYPFAPRPRGVDRTPYEITDQAINDYADDESRVRSEVLRNFFANPKSKQHWPVVPAARLKKIWGDYARQGFVRDERGLDEIAATMVENVMRLETNTIMCGHTPQDPKDFAQDVDEFEYDEETHGDDFGEHVLDERGQYRISDFALEPLVDDAVRLRVAETPEQKLLLLDRMLNRIHPRSDIAAMFVEGGCQTLDQIARGV